MATRLNSAKNVRGEQRKLEIEQAKSLGKKINSEESGEIAIYFPEKVAETQKRTEKQQEAIKQIQYELEKGSKVTPDYEKMKKDNDDYLQKSKMLEKRKS